MDTTKQTVYALIAAAIGEQPLDLPPDIPWGEVCDELSMHAISGLFSEQLPTLNLPPDVLTFWKKQSLMQFSGGMQLRHAQSKLVVLLKAENIPFAILKGTAAAMYYPDPTLRIMGDVDLFVRPADFERVLAFLADNGYERTDPDEDNFRHTQVQKDGARFEVHRHFSHLNNPAHARYIDGRMEEDLSRVEWIADEWGEFPALPTVTNGLVLLEHVAHHLEGGLGLRQIIDWVAYVKCCLSDTQWHGEFAAAATACGLDTLAIVLTRMGQLFLGLPTAHITWCADADEVLCEQLMDLVYDYGNFGNKDIVGNRVATVMGTAKTPATFFRYLQEVGCRNWPAAKRHRWLRPFAWAYQLGRFAVRGVRNAASLPSVKASAQTIKQRDRLFEQLGVYRGAKGTAKPNDEML